jgi:hypothetical protein
VQVSKPADFFCCVFGLHPPHDIIKQPKKAWFSSSLLGTWWFHLKSKLTHTLDVPLMMSTTSNIEGGIYFSVPTHEHESWIHG